MGETAAIDLFCEDAGHEQCVRAIIAKVASREGVEYGLSVRCASGGHGRAVSEFKAFQTSIEKGLGAAPDLLVLVVDGNCRGWREGVRELQASIRAEVFPRSVVGCPDPHIERWCMADPAGFVRAIGGAPVADPGKCERNAYKAALSESIERAGKQILTSAAEYASKIVNEMDLYKSGQSRPDLGAFCGDLCASMKRMKDDLARGGGG